MPVSTVHLTFEGMLLLFLNDNRDYCDVGFLKDIPHHTAEVLITKIPRLGAAEILKHWRGSNLKDQLRLEVDKANRRVRLFRSSAPDPFRRVPSANKEDFRWAVDLEGHEVYNTTLKPGLNLGKLKQRLRIFDGMFYNQNPLSENELTREGADDRGPVRLGKVAVKLRAAIELESGAAAIFVYGSGSSDKIQLSPQDNIDYGVYVSNKRDPGHGGAHVDAENYHPVVAGSHPRVRLGRHPPVFAAATPDAVCLPGWMSRTILP